VTLLDSVRTRTGEEYSALRSDALSKQAAIDAAVAKGGCTGRAVRTKLWVQGLDHDIGATRQRSTVILAYDHAFGCLPHGLFEKLVVLG
jgi:hypothetical protein